MDKREHKNEEEVRKVPLRRKRRIKRQRAREGEREREKKKQSEKKERKRKKKEKWAIKRKRGVRKACKGTKTPRRTHFCDREPCPDHFLSY